MRTADTEWYPLPLFELSDLISFHDPQDLVGSLLDR
jgi:hypothetical protein